MPKSREQKAQAVTELSEKIKNSTGIFVVAPESVDPNEAADLKIALSEIGGEYHLVKNSLFKRAVSDLGLEADENFEVGQNAVVFIGEQSPEAAKVLAEFAKETEKITFKGGYLEQKKITPNDIKALAELPSREQMLAQVLATMNAPVSGFVNVLAGNIRGVVNVIEAYKEQKSAT